MRPARARDGSPALRDQNVPNDSKLQLDAQFTKDGGKVALESVGIKYPGTAIGTCGDVMKVIEPVEMLLPRH